MIESHMGELMAEQLLSSESQKTNLEEQNLVGLEQSVSH